MQASSTQPYMEVTEQPIEKFRFRYKSEMHGTHGSLTGQSASRNKKSFPTVVLHNYFGEAVIRCSLYQLPKSQTAQPSPHSHSLVIRNMNEDRNDPHDMVVSKTQGFTAVFQGMGVIHTARKNIEEELLRKLITQKQFEWSRPVTILEEERLKARAKTEATEMNLNQVCLCFEAFEKNGTEWSRICAPVYSTPINNMSEFTVDC